MKSIVLALVVTVSQIALAAVPIKAPDLPPRVVAPTDTAKFRHLVLDNGIRVVLMSDAKLNKSSASLVVNVGQIDDPRDTEGLAHFTEHMLFLGTEKYPDVSEYSNFIRTNGGRNNAYTSTDHTNYHFEVRHEAFPAALDRFAQFFIAPRFNPEFVGREVNAVHNEAMRHVQNDERRQIGVFRELYDPSSGESKFSTGNKETLAKATPQAVRAFYESHYSADRMAVALAGTASLDELEKLARANFSAVPRRDVPPVVREAKYLPRKAALRMAMVEPVKEVRALTLEFVLPATRPDFAAKPVQLVDELVSYAGEGGLVALLKREGLATKVQSEDWERTGEYSSFFITVELTPQGERENARVLGLVHGYLESLRRAPFPAAFYAERARVAALNETYGNRGEGMALATKLANQALFYPLEAAERATDVWGKPDEAAYRRVLAALTPDNVLVSLMAKGVPTERQERIYGTKYSYREDSGSAYAALTRPAQVASFHLPSANPFVPKATPILPERALALVDEPGLELYYAQDVEFQRPITALVFRFVPAREIATPESAALLALYEKALEDYLEPVLTDARLAGTDVSIDGTIEGLRIAVSGYGDSPERLAATIGAKLRSFSLPPKRFDAVKEALVRTQKSYLEAEAYLRARDRRDVLAREFHFLPDQMLAPTERAQEADLRAFAQRFFSRGKLEVLVHGHATPEQAIAAARDMAKGTGHAPAPAEALLRRRNVVIAPAETLVDTGQIAGVNSAIIEDYVLPDDSPKTRAAALVAANFLGEPFYTELRTRQQLGYIVGSNVGSSHRQGYFTFIVQSSGYAPDELRRRAETFIATLPAQLAKVSDEQWKTLVAGARSTLQEKPKSIAQKAMRLFDAAYVYEREWDRRESSLAALETLKRDEAVALLSAALAPEQARRRVVMLQTKEHPMADVVKPTYADREAWKSGRKYQ
jgi:insulysin